VQCRNLFQDNNFPKSYLPQIRGSSWHKKQIKIIRRGHYSSNNFQDSNKIKSTEKKHWVISQECFFLTPLSKAQKGGNQVLSNEALRSTVSSRAPLTTLGTLEFSKDDSTCKSLLVELKVLPILKTSAV
jgi:hypothetical protein